MLRFPAYSEPTPNGVLLHGDCLDRLREMPDCCIDAVVTDPPYELGFMGKRWDASGIAYNVDLWREVLRVLKPGGHLLAFGGTRTYHRMVCAIEDAGFEIRDSLHWTYGSGFPKSLDVAKAVTATETQGGSSMRQLRKARQGDEYEPTGQDDPNGDTYDAKKLGRGDDGRATELTDTARQWSGWGTALKPSHEPIVVARKPLDGTVAHNVLTWGTGALNIDGCRVGTEVLPEQRAGQARLGTFERSNRVTPERTGRWPSNTLLTHAPDCNGTCAPGCPVAEMDRQSGKVGAAAPASGPTYSGPSKSGSMAGAFKGNGDKPPAFHADEGGASRFFPVFEWSELDAPFRYVAKPSKKERNAGLDGLPERAASKLDGGAFESASTTATARTAANHHPTVKPSALLAWLVRLACPPGGVVLDMFMGSGTTAVACELEGVRWIGCELTEEYVPIIEGRAAWAAQERARRAEPTKAAKVKAPPEALTLPLS